VALAAAAAVPTRLSLARARHRPAPWDPKRQTTDAGTRGKQNHDATRSHRLGYRSTALGWMQHDLGGAGRGGRVGVELTESWRHVMGGHQRPNDRPSARAPQQLLASWRRHRASACEKRCRTP
jgi:hypothetical protein